MTRLLAVPIPHTRPDAVARLDEAAFTEFYRATSRGLWSYVYRVTGHAADADDIVQEAFCRLLRSAPDNHDEEHWRRYLYRVASNLVVDRWRHAARQRQDEREASDLLVQPPRSDDDDRREVARTFAQLSSRERALLWLAYVEDESHQEIARSLGLGRRSIKVLLFRARRKLRELLRSREIAARPR